MSLKTTLQSRNPVGGAPPITEWKSRIVDVPMLAARTTLELHLVLLCRSLLRVRPIGLRDNFFELGGDSQLAERLIAEIKTTTGRSLSLTKFLEQPTVEHLSNMVKQTRWSPNWSSLVPIREGGSRPPLFFVHAPRGYVFLYYHVANHLDPDLPVYGLQALGVNRKVTPHFSFQEMAAHYIKEMSTLR